jgi:hypothetical protein
MKESYRENLTNRFAYEAYAWSSNVPAIGWESGYTGQPLSSEIRSPVCRPCSFMGKGTSLSPSRQAGDRHGGVLDSHHVSKFQAREPGYSNDIQRGREPTLLRQHSVDRSLNVSGASTGMHGAKKSNGSVVIAKLENKRGPKAPAEWTYERDPVQSNIEQANLYRTQNRNKVK